LLTDERLAILCGDGQSGLLRDVAPTAVPQGVEEDHDASRGHLQWHSRLGDLLFRRNLAAPEMRAFENDRPSVCSGESLLAQSPDRADAHRWPGALHADVLAVVVKGLWAYTKHVRASSAVLIEACIVWIGRYMHAV